MATRKQKLNILTSTIFIDLNYQSVYFVMLFFVLIKP